MTANREMTAGRKFNKAIAKLTLKMVECAKVAVIKQIKLKDVKDNKNESGHRSDL